MEWNADIANDRDKDFNLYIELMKEEKFWGKIARDDKGELRLTVYSSLDMSVPLSWLKSIIELAERDL